MDSLSFAQPSDFYSLIAAVITAIIIAIIGPIVVTWYKNYSNKKANKIKKDLPLHSKIDYRLEKIFDEMEADLAFIAQFHNGGNFYPMGKSIQKFSVFYEKTNSNYDSLKSTLNQIPVSLFSKSLQDLEKEGIVPNPDLDPSEYKCNFSSFFKEKGFPSYYLFSLEDLKNQFIGFLCICFKEEYKLDIEDILYLEKESSVIGTLLNDYLKNS